MTQVKTYSRAHNAVNAAKAWVRENLPTEYLIDDVISVEIEIEGSGGQYAAKLIIDGDKATADAVRALVGDRMLVEAAATLEARVVPLRKAEVGDAEEPATDAEAPQDERSVETPKRKRGRKAKQPAEQSSDEPQAFAVTVTGTAGTSMRAAAANERRLWVAPLAGKQGNPFRSGTTAWTAWQTVHDEPGITYGECKARGLRMQVLQVGIRFGYISTEAPAA